MNFAARLRAAVPALVLGSVSLASGVVYAAPAAVVVKEAGKPEAAKQDADKDKQEKKEEKVDKDNKIKSPLGIPKGTGPLVYGPVVDFVADVQPIFKRSCVECHGPHRGSGGLQLTTGGKMMEGGFSGVPVIPENGDGSYLLKRIRGQEGEDRMPLRGAPLTLAEEDTIWRWIKQGARFPREAPPEFEPKPAGLSRLTVLQFGNALRSLFGAKVHVPGDLEPDMIISGSSVVGAGRVGMSRRATEMFAQAAARVAREAVADPAWRNEWLGCLASVPVRGKSAASATVFNQDAAVCVENFIEHFGRRAWRRPLKETERARYVYVVADAAATRRSLLGGIEAAVAGMLQSPYFLYRVEVGEPDADPRFRKLTDFEIATRLSLFLTGTIPDEELLNAAQSGKLSDGKGLAVAAQRLLAQPQARETVRSFFAELFTLDRLRFIVKSRKGFAGSKTIAAAMREETLRLVEHVLFEGDHDLREIFAADYTFVNGELARHYGLPAPADEASFVRVNLPPGGSRIGVLGHASFLSIHSSRTESSPTLRGKFIREQLLCQAVPPPPPDVSNVLPDVHADGKPRTTRMRLDSHRTVAQCRACHKAMDPMGLAFENFDSAGTFRTQEHGLPIDTTGDLDDVPFADAAGLSKLLRESPKIGICMARALYRFAVGQLESDADEPLIAEFSRNLESSGYRFHSLLLAVVASRGFRYVSSPQ